jgi:hypothetical protein
MLDKLFLRRTIIAGKTARHDYLVIWNELRIGRIRKTIGSGGRRVWQWDCTLPNVPQPSHHRGRARSLDDAKAQFRSAWSDLQSRLSYTELEQARALAHAEQGKLA